MFHSQTQLDSCGVRHHKRPMMVTFTLKADSYLAILFMYEVASWLV